MMPQRTRGATEALRRIADEVGDRVSELVRECSDVVAEPGAEKPPWRERKVGMIARLSTMSHQALLVVAADKLHNARATVIDLKDIGDEVWSRFKTGREGFIWYHDQVLAGLEQRIPESRSVTLLREEVSRL